MPDDVLFSIVVLVKKNLHLLPLTIESLKVQDRGSFEVLLIDPLGSGRFVEFAKKFSMPIRVIESVGRTDAELMNRAVGEAQGRYIQFLYPGDRYISQQAISYLSELVHESPHLVYSAFLQRDFEKPPQAISFPLNIQSLQKGDFPTMYRSSWFLKEKILEMGGFNERLTYRPSFDLLCRLFLGSEARALYTRRVLTDYEPSKSTSHSMVGYAAETFRILYRHFGIKAALRWFLVKDRSWLIRWTLHFIKGAFFRKSI